MKKTFAILVLIAFFSTVQAQNAQFVRDMEGALTLHNAASTVTAEQKALDSFEGLTKKYQNEWLAFYWTAHLYGQTGRLYSKNNDKLKSYLNMAQEYYEKAWKLKKNKSKSEKSELYALQSLIYRLTSRTHYDPSRSIYDDKKEYSRYTSLSLESLQMAEQENPNNPRVHLNKGIGFIYNQQYKEGLAVLNKTVELFEKYPPASKIHPSWGRPWVEAWLPRAEQGKRFAEAMEFAVHMHDTASSVLSELKALDALKKTTDMYPDQWLPGYWTAYILTQIARLKDRVPDFPDDLDPAEMILESQKFFDRSFAVKPEKTPEEKSDFHMLQGFIYSWMESLVATTEPDKTKYKKLRTDEYEAAVRENPKNPLMYVLAGINLTGKDHDYRDVMAGIGLLNYAEELFARKPQRGLTTYWNKDFIPFWRGRAEKRLQEMLNESD